MTRFLGIDYGTKRIGLAVGDDVTRIASPLSYVRAEASPRQSAAAVMAVADEYAAEAFVVGLPTNMDGSEGPQAQITRQFANELQRQSGKPVHMADERLSSRAAAELVEPAELSRKQRGRVEDAVAAQVILQQFLDHLAG